MRTSSAAAIVALLGICATLPPAELEAQTFSDIKARYSRMFISKVKFNEQSEAEVGFFRQNFEFELGSKQGFLGLIFQHTHQDEAKAAPGATPEDGLMLSGGYNFIFSRAFRFDVSGRLRIWGDTNPAQPLYAADTDILVKVVTFIPEGIGRLAGKPVYPSSYVGMQLNRYGRVQNVAGLGAWWSGIGLYATGFMSLNGVENLQQPGDRAGEQFAALKTSGLSVAANYHIFDFILGVTQHFAVLNGGNDFTMSVQFQHFFGK